MSMCNVLAVIGDREAEARVILDAAVALADAENARLTLVKTCDDGRTYVWVTPFACGGAYVPPTLDSPIEAGRRLARVAAEVPQWIPVTTMVLGPRTQMALLELLSAGHYGAVVAERDLLAHCRRLRRRLRQEGIRSVEVTLRSVDYRAAGRIAAHFSSSEHTEDGVLDGLQVPQELGRRSRGNLRLGIVRRLAGAGGKQ